MRVTLLNQFFPPDLSPTAHLASSLARHRARLGDKVTVITSKAGYVAGDDVGAAHGDERMRVVRLWNPGLGRRSTVRRLADYLAFCFSSLLRMLTLRRQDVVVVMTTPPFLAVAAMAHKVLHRKTRIVLWSMDCYPDVAERYGKIRRGGFVSRVLRRINRTVYRHLDHVVCLDGAMRDLLATQYAAGPNQPRMAIIPNWEDLGAFPDVGDAASEPNGSAFVVLYQGNLGYGHRFDTALEAAQLAGDEVHFVYVGGGVRWSALEAARDRAALKNVELREYVPKDGVPALLASADAALITLDDLALGIMSPSKLHSSLAMGLPILYVGPPGSNVDEAINRFGCGYSIRHGDAAGLVEAVRALRDGDRMAMAKASRHAFETAYSDEATLPQWDRVIDGS